MDHRDKACVPTSGLNFDYNPEDYSETQTDFEKGLTKMKKDLKVYNQTQFQRQFNKIKDPKLRKDWADFYENINKAANIEACLHQTAGVTQLAWMPADKSDPNAVDPVSHKLLGKYVLKVRRLDEVADDNFDDAPTLEIYPDSWWVEQEFDPKILGTAQKFAIDHWESFKLKAHEPAEHGFFNVEDQGVCLPLENAEVNQLRFIPERKKGKTIYPAQWIGICNAQNNKKIYLDEEFVLTNFSREIIADVKRHGMQGDKKFIDVPPGDAKKQDHYLEHLQKGAKMKYRQKEGEHTCLVFSFASALHSIGGKQFASELFGSRKKIVECCDTIQQFSDAVTKLNAKFKFTILDTSKWNILKNHEANLIVAVLQGSDGKEDHGVTVCGKWLFDSNFEYALPLCQETLDLCCSTEESKETFVKVVDARICDYINAAKIAADFEKVISHKKKRKLRRQKKKKADLVEGAEVVGFSNKSKNNNDDTQRSNQCFHKRKKPRHSKK